MTDSFVFYKSFMDALEYVPEEEYCSCLKALLFYAFDGENIADTMTSKMFMALVIPQIDANKNRRQNGSKGAEHGKKGGRPRKETPEEETENPIGVIDETPNVNGNVNGNANENVNVNEEKKDKRERFVPPTVEEVEAYCLERNNGIDAEAFVAFYDSKGWKVGKDPMKNWKSAVITWEKKRKAEHPMPDKPRPIAYNRFQNFPPRSDREENDANIAKLIAMQTG